MKLLVKTLLGIMLISLLSVKVSSQVVCSQNELIKELMEDLLDNGKLDCLRSSSNPNQEDETEEQSKRRIAANWTGDCSFEAQGDEENDWRKSFLEIYGVKSFVDVFGNPPKEPAQPYQDFDDQADMCEIVRALVGNGFFSFGKNMDSISLELLDHIDCIGFEGQTQVCAATVGSFAEMDKWVIFLNGQSFRINGIPQYRIDNTKAATQ